MPVTSARLFTLGGVKKRRRGSKLQVIHTHKHTQLHTQINNREAAMYLFLQLTCEHLEELTKYCQKSQNEGKLVCGIPRLFHCKGSQKKKVRKELEKECKERVDEMIEEHLTCGKG